MANIWERFSAAVKAFRTGPAEVGRFESSSGHSRENFAPAKYGEYLVTSGAVYACANLRARNLAGLPLKLFTGTVDDRSPAKPGALAELLGSVNPHWTWNRLIQMTELSLCLWGEGMWVLERGPSGKGVPTEIWWVRSDKMKPVRHPVLYLTGWVYEDNGQKLLFTSDEVIWFRYPNPLDEFAGLSPIASARLSIDTAHAALRSNRMIFENGSQVAGLISPRDKETSWSKEQVESLTTMFERRFKGVDKAHRLAVLGQAADISSVSISPKDAQFIELMRWGKGDVAMVYLTPPELIGDHEHATYSNIDQAYKGFWTDCLVPEASMIAGEITEQLVPMFKGEASFAEFETSGVAALQEDRKEVTEQARTFWSMGVPLNRVLQVFQPNLLPPGKDGYPWGDEPGGALPAVVDAQPVELPPSPTDDQADDGTPAAAARSALKALQAMKAHPGVVYGSDEHKTKAGRFGRAIDRHKDRIKAKVSELLKGQGAKLIAQLRAGKSMKDGGALDDEFEADFWNELFAEGIEPALRDATDAAGKTTMDDLSASIAFDVSRPEVETFLSRRAQRFAEHVNATTWETVKATLNEGREAGEGIDQLAERIDEAMGDRIRSSAETIARTETMGALNGGALLAARQSGVVDAKGWLAAIDGRERTSHKVAHEQYQDKPIPLDDDFEVGDGAGPAPGEIGLAEEDCNCCCTLTFEVKDDEGEDGETRAVASTVVDGLRSWLEERADAK